MVLDFGLRPIEVTLSQTVLDKLKAGEARAWLVRVKNPQASEIDLAANSIHVVPKWDYNGASTDIVVKLEYNQEIFKTLDASHNTTVYEYEAFWHDVLEYEELGQTAGDYKPHVVPLKLSVTKNDVVIAEASIHVHYEPNSWHFNAQVNLVSQKMIYQRHENPVVKVFYNSTKILSAGTVSGVIKAQSNGASIYTVTDEITDWTELTNYWDEVDYDPDDEHNNQFWYETLTFELTNTPDQTAFQVPPPFTAYSSVALAFSPENNGHGLRIMDIIVDGGGGTPLTPSLTLDTNDSSWESEFVDFDGQQVAGYHARSNDPISFRMNSEFTGGGLATISATGWSANNGTFSATEYVNFEGSTFTSGSLIEGTITISVNANVYPLSFRFVVTVGGVTSDPMYLSGELIGELAPSITYTGPLFESGTGLWPQAWYGGIEINSYGQYSLPFRLTFPAGTTRVRVTSPVTWLINLPDITPTADQTSADVVINKTDAFELETNFRIELLLNDNTTPSANYLITVLFE